MKLGTQTNSLTNHLYSRMTKGAPEPKVGMAATVLAWTDRYAAKVTEVRELGKHVVVTVDDDIGHKLYFRREPTEAGGFQYREVAPNKQGFYALVKGGHGLIVGISDPYRDPCF